MSDRIANTQDKSEERPLTKQELRFCNLYMNGGLEYAGRPKKCFVEVFGEDTVKNPYASANYPMDRPYVPVHTKAPLSSERFEIEMMAVKLQVARTFKTVTDEMATSDYIDRFGVLLPSASLKAVSVNAVGALMDIFPIRHKEENRLRVEGSDGNVIFNVIVPQNPMADSGKKIQSHQGRNCLVDTSGDNGRAGYLRTPGQRGG